MEGHSPPALKARLESAAGASLELAFRPMFGGLAAYSGGKIFASLSDVGLALKLGPADREALLREPGAAPLRYTPDMPPSRNYVTVPAPILADDAALASWLRRSADHVATLPARPAKKPGRPRTR
jgi:TfoX/Sxy family transcriptional regulator of competence genes